MEESTQNGSGNSFLEKHHTSIGPVLGFLLILLVLILGGLYLWGSMLSHEVVVQENQRTIPNNEPETPRAEADMQILDTVSSSNELDMLENDLESTKLDPVDSELMQIETELDRVMQ